MGSIAGPATNKGKQVARVARRDFLKLVGVGGVGAGAGFMLAEAIRHPLEHLIPETLPPEEFSPGVAVWYNSVCAMCSAGCGISVRTREGRPKIIQGNPSHPVSQGRLCSLGQAGVQALYNPDRLTTPLARSGERGAGAFTATTWDDGVARVAERLAALRERGQRDRICVLSEGVRGTLADVFERFTTQLGARLLYHDFAHPAALYAAHERLFGERRLPYYDLRNARYLLSFGADFLGQWLSPVHHSLSFGYARQGRADARMRVVQIEPRMSISGAAADEWIAARPGAEGLLALAIARRIVERGVYRGADREAWAQALAPYTIERAASASEVSPDVIARIADAFGEMRPSLAIGGGGAGAHTNGVDTLTAVHLLNYLVGAVGAEGGLVFNPAPPIAAEAPSRHASYRSLLALLEDARQGRIEALIVNRANPVFTLPRSADVEAALARIPLIVSLSSFMDETTMQADVILPAHTYLESWGDDFPEPGVGFAVGAVMQPVVAPLYDTRGTGDILLTLALRAGAALPWQSMEEAVRTTWRAIHERGAQAEPAQNFEAFFTSVQQAGVWGQASHRATASAQVSPAIVANLNVAAEFDVASEDYPLLLQPYLSPAFHDGRGANLPWLQELPDPLTSIVYGSWIELNPQTARELGLSEGDVVEVRSAHGSVSAPVFLYPAIRPDVVAMPIGQGHREYGRYARNRGANPIAILAPAMEPTTGALAWSATRVQLAPTGRRVSLIKTSGNSRELGRNITSGKRTADSG
jgi:menaquinone reductase, molybdopterin-binding-like subunit